MKTSNETKSTSTTPIVDPFPKPNTIPSGWDVSGMVSDHRASSTEFSEAKTPEPKKHSSK
jgi:hypothetical protein